jgi:hypothetical protein
VEQVNNMLSLSNSVLQVLAATGPALSANGGDASALSDATTTLKSAANSVSAALGDNKDTAYGAPPPQRPRLTCARSRVRSSRHAHVPLPPNIAPSPNP